MWGSYPIIDPCSTSEDEWGVKTRFERSRHTRNLCWTFSKGITLSHKRDLGLHSGRPESGVRRKGWGEVRERMRDRRTAPSFSVTEVVVYVDLSLGSRRQMES